MSDHRAEIPQTIQAIPSVGAIALYLAEKDIAWWAAVFGLVFLLLQIAHLAWKWNRDIRVERDRRESLLHGGDDD